MTFSSPPLRATSIRHHDRGLTLVFGPDGQVSLIGFDGGAASQAPYTFPVGNTGTLTSTPSRPGEPTSASPIPNLEATSASLTGTSTSIFASAPAPTSPSTFISSSSTLSSYDPSSTPTDTDTNLPSIPTVNYPTPSPTPVTNPKDHGVGAPFYLAIVLASISFIGCVAAFIAWWIRSRSRRHDLEFDDPWHHPDTISDGGSAISDNANALEKGDQTHAETQTRPYYLPASLVRRNSNLLAVPHTIPAVENGIPQNGTSRIASYSDPGRYPYSHDTNDVHSKNRDAAPNSAVPSSQTTNFAPHPGMQRIQTGLSVQESMRTLGRLRVANRVPGDVTSGDEGGMNVPRPQNNAGPPPAADMSRSDNVLVEEDTRLGQRGQPLQEGDSPTEPPGPATLSWGRRMDTIAALRRTRRRTPGITAENASQGGHSYSRLHGKPSGMMSQALVPTPQGEDDRFSANSTPDYLGWKGTLKSSFWQAVDAMTGNRPPDPESGAANGGSGSGFTPAPQRVASRRSPVSFIHPSTTFTVADPHGVQRKETKAWHDPALRSVATHEIPRSLTPSGYVGSSTRQYELQMPHVSETPFGSIGSPPPRVSRLNRGLSANTHRQNPDSLRTDTSSMYSTESAVARANLRKYGYESRDTIPSSWSALGAVRESQLNLERSYLSLPGPASSSPSPLSATPSELTFGSALLSSSVSMHTRSRTPAHSEKDLVGSDASTFRSDKYGNITSYGETASSKDSISRNGTIRSGCGTMGHGTISLASTSSMLSRRKGVTRRKRPKLPPRAPSSTSSVQSMESGFSIRQVAVRRALLERQKKVKATENFQGREDTPTRNRDPSSLLV